MHIKNDTRSYTLYVNEYRLFFDIKLTMEYLVLCYLSNLLMEFLYISQKVFVASNMLEEV
jgi:hypothetical protein